MIVTSVQHKHAEAEIAKNGTGAADHEKGTHDTEILIATVSGIHRKHYLEVSIWADMLRGLLRRNNPRARFDIDIRGENLVSRTNQSIDIIAAHSAPYTDALGRSIADVDRKIAITITFDPAFAERMEASIAK